MIFYMATRYEGEGGEPDLEVIDYLPDDNNIKEPIHAKLEALLQWHEEDPVDDWERNRNEVIYSFQNNRNPFIDHPEYVGLIWDTVTVVHTVIREASKLNIYPNPADDFVSIDNPDNLSLTLFSSTGIPVEQVRDDFIDLSDIYPGLYILGMKDSRVMSMRSQRIVVR